MKRKVTPIAIPVIEEIIELAETEHFKDRKIAKKPITLLKILQAYNVVLKNHRVWNSFFSIDSQLIPSEDTRYYRFLLKLSVDSAPSWRTKLVNLQNVTLFDSLIQVLQQQRESDCSP